MNLKDEIASQVSLLRPTTLNQAMQDALESEVWCSERNFCFFFVFEKLDTRLWHRTRVRL